MDYEKAYTNAVARAKQAIKDCGHNEGRKRMIEDIFPELADPDRIRKELIELIGCMHNADTRKGRWLAWLEKQGKTDWDDYDKAVIYAIYNTLSHCNVTKCGCLEVTDMLEWLEELEKQGKRNSADPFFNWLEKQGKRNNIIERLTAFAVHLQKRGAFRDDLCMDFEHEAQSFIESQMEKRKKSLKK